MAPTPKKFKRVASLKDLPPGSGTSVKVGETMVALFNVDGKICAVDDTCIHAGGPLGDGALNGSIVTCPWHGWQFDVVKGCAVVSEAVKITTYETEIRDESIYVSTEPSQIAIR